MFSFTRIPFWEFIFLTHSQIAISHRAVVQGSGDLRSWLQGAQFRFNSPVLRPNRPRCSPGRWEQPGDAHVCPKHGSPLCFRPKTTWGDLALFGRITTQNIMGHNLCCHCKHHMGQAPIHHRGGGGHIHFVRRIYSDLPNLITSPASLLKFIACGSSGSSRSFLSCWNVVSKLLEAQPDMPESESQWGQKGT